MDEFTSCPYNHQHRVPKSRIQQHLIKCEKVYPRLAICPYNATHRVKDSEIEVHVTDCPSKEQFLLDNKPEKSNAILTTPKPIPQKEYINENDPDFECWD